MSLFFQSIAILDIAEKVGKDTEERLNKTYGNKVVFIKCDVSKEDEIKNAFDAVVAKFKKVDVIVNNAGIMNDNPQMWRVACDVNYVSNIFLITFYINRLNIFILSICKGILK